MSKILSYIFLLLFVFPILLGDAATIKIIKPQYGVLSLRGAGSNVTFDTSAKSSAGVGVTAVTISITVANNANRLLVVMAGAGDSILIDRTVDSVSSDLSGAFTAVSSGAADDANWTRMEAWRLIAPAVGTHTITVTYSSGGANTAQAVAMAASLYGVDQTTPVGTATVVNGTTTSTAPTGSVTLGSDDMLIAGCASDSDATFSWTTGTSLQVTTGVSSDTCYGLASNTGTGSILATASTSNNKYSLVIIPVNGAP